MPVRLRHRHLPLPLATVLLKSLLVMATALQSNSPQATLTPNNSSLLQHTAVLPLDTSLQMPTVPPPEEFQA